MFPFLRNSNQSTEKQPTKIYKSMEKNKKHINQLFSYGLNRDFSFRELTAKYSNKPVIIYFYTTIIDRDYLSKYIIEPLLEEDGSSIEQIVTLSTVKEIVDFDELTEQINNGYAIVFEDGSDKALAMDISQFQYRSISQPENESVIKGPKEGFTESLGINVSLLRKRFHDKQLINETKTIGERSKLDVSVMYIKDVVNDEILETVKKKIDSIKVDNIRNLALLEQHLEERPYSLVPSILYTERPDKAASYLEDGYIIILMNNSPACLIVPITFWAFFQSPEDRYLRFLYGNFTRLIRFSAFFISVFISAIYVGVTNFHSEMIPPDLLLAITSARERVPFPLILEIFLMEFAFELIREAGIRIPNPLGPTIGIVGALILGQAAVEANVVSPIVVIIVALSGLTSFAVSDISMNYSIRISRFMFIAAAGWFGMFSLTGAFIIWISYLCSIKSFGVPFFSPVTPMYKSPGDNLFRRIVKREFYRPGNIKPKDLVKKETNNEN